MSLIVTAQPWGHFNAHATSVVVILLVGVSSVGLLLLLPHLSSPMYRRMLDTGAYYPSSPTHLGH